jgi:hypothetical protein
VDNTRPGNYLPVSAFSVTAQAGVAGKPVTPAVARLTLRTPSLSLPIELRLSHPSRLLHLVRALTEAGQALWPEAFPQEAQ